MNPLPSLFHVTVTSPAELPDPIPKPTEPPPTSHSIHSTFSPTIAVDIATTNETPTGPPPFSTSQACLSQPITVLPSSFYPPAYLAPSGPPTESPTSFTLSTRSLTSRFNSKGELRNNNMTTETTENRSVEEYPHPATDITAIRTTDRVAALHKRSVDPIVC